MAKSVIIFANQYDRTTWTEVPATINDDVVLTDSSFVYACDIEHIMNDFGVTPRTPLTKVRELLGSSAIDDLTYDLANHLNLDRMSWENERAIALRKWNNLGSDLKDFFGTPANFYKYCSDPNNYVDEAKGFNVSKPDETTKPVEITE